MDDASSSSTGVTGQVEELADRAAGRAGSVVAEAKDHAGTVGREAKDHARGLLDRARQDVNDQAQQRSGQAAGSLRSLADQLGALADGDADGAGPLSDYVRDARDRVGRLAGRLDDGPDAVLDDLRNFARNRPLVFLGAAGVLGFVAGRLVRASRAESSGTSSPSSATAELVGASPPAITPIATGGQFTSEPVVPPVSPPVGVDAPLTTPVGAAGEPLDAPLGQFSGPGADPDAGGVPR